MVSSGDMTAIEIAIRDAVDGGWRVFAPSNEPIRVHDTGTWPMIHGTSPSGVIKLWPLASAFLDAAFWQSLGKARGWKTMLKNKHSFAEIELKMRDAISCFEHGNIATGHLLLEQSKMLSEQFLEQEGWDYHWHRFIDHLASGGDAESFFQSL